VNFLPIVQRELRVISRRPWMYWVRAIFGLAGILAALAMFFDGPPGRVARGEAMLWTLSIVTMGLALFCGGLLTADCISSEKREDTLGLLFLTNLKGHDVVAGKIAIHGMTTMCGLLSVFPVFFLPIQAGGVTWAETLRVLLGITVSFVFALTLGVWISARSRDARNAVMVTMSVLFLIVAAPLLWIAIQDGLFRGKPSLVGIPQLSPVMLLFFALDSWYSGPQASAVYWISIGLFVTASATLAVFASRDLPKVWRHEELKPPSDAPHRAWRTFRLARIRAGEFRRRLRFDSPNPFQDFFRHRFKEFFWGRLFQSLLTLLFVVMLLFSLSDDEPLFLALMTVFAMHAMAKFAFAFDATRALGEDKRSSALELLLITPAGERAVAEGLSAAFRIRFKAHARRLIVFTLALQLAAIFNGKLRGDDLFLVSSFLWGPMIWTWSDYRTISWVGMHHSLKQSTHLKAMLKTLASLMLPWAPYFFVLFCMASARADEVAAGMVTWGWAIGAAIYQSVKTRSRRSRVLHDFRVLATGSTNFTEDNENPLESAAGLFPTGSGAWRLAGWISALGSRR
jgi:ABC-type transport system involved in cytochrome c biogenesis permease component